jgi:2-polyprenyl-3-methyl-5-hydroxy-6-metoxy-1,4-benzoquinol methylase
LTSGTDIKEYIPEKWEEVACPICGSSESSLYERFGYNLKFTYVLCHNCSNVYQTPRPEYGEHFLKASYANYYVFDEKYEYNDSPYNDFDKELDEILTYDRQAVSILDVGCAMGDFLYRAKPRYPRVYGAEISEKMAAFVAKKLQVKIFNEQFDAIQTEERFSCIHMSHVIEHIPDPHVWLQKARELLLPGGSIVLCTPNMFSLSRRFTILLRRLGLKKGSWSNPMRTPDHLFEPNIKSMKFLLEKNGYEVTAIYTYSRSNMISKGFFAFIFHKLLKCGSNIRAYARVNQG